MPERGMPNGQCDRRGFLKGAVALVAAAGGGALIVGSAHAAAPRSRAAKSMPLSLRPVGVNVPCGTYATNVPVKLKQLGAVTLDPTGGVILQVRRAAADRIDL